MTRFVNLEVHLYHTGALPKGRYCIHKVLLSQSLFLVSYEEEALDILYRDPNFESLDLYLVLSVVHNTRYRTSQVFNNCSTNVLNLVQHLRHATGILHLHMVSVTYVTSGKEQNIFQSSTIFNHLPPCPSKTTR